MSSQDECPTYICTICGAKRCENDVDFCAFCGNPHCDGHISFFAGVPICKRCLGKILFDIAADFNLPEEISALAESISEEAEKEGLTNA